MSYQIYHNPRCRKSRDALQVLQDHGIQPKIVLYLDNPPSASELQHLAHLMKKSPQEFIRKGEEEYKEHVKGKDLSEYDLFEIMSKHSILIERPIVVKDDQEAVLGRPPEEVLKLL